MMELHIVTQNVQGMGSPVKRQLVADWMSRERIDVLCLQETYAVSGCDWCREFPYHTVFHAYGTNHSRGVSVIVRQLPHLQCRLLGVDPEGRYLLVEIGYCKTVFDLLSLYAPTVSTQRSVFFQDVTTLLSPGRLLIICGDFNCVVDPNRDRQSVARLSQRTSDTEAIQGILTGLSVIDIYRQRHPSTPGYTWTRLHTHTAARLDMFLVSSLLDRRVKSVSVLSTAFSDHFGVSLRVGGQTEVSRGGGYWKFNSVFLSEEPFRRRIMAFWLHWRYKKDRFPSVLQWWDAGKARLKGICKQYGISRQKRLRRSVARLERSLQHAQEAVQAGNMAAIAKIDFFRQHLQQCIKDRLRGAQVRSRAQWVDSGETSQKFFEVSEKVKGERNHISHLSCDGETVSNVDGILRATRRFYRDLYSEDTVDVDAGNRILSAVKCTLSSSESEICEGPLTLEECTAALHQMKPNKSHGLDGLTAEFYRTFWHLLSSDFLEVVVAISDLKVMPRSLRTGVIRLIPKKGDKSDLANWRPISLLNLDYKLISKVLANRLRKVLGFVIHPDQTCSIPGRSIHDKWVRDVIQYCVNTNTDGALISLDQTKAFDRVDWNYLFRVLATFRFGPSFCTWIKILYNDIGSHVIINGFLTSRIELRRGVRQGFPLSRMLYVLCAEPLAASIRSSPIIRGIPSPGDPDRDTIKVVG